MYPAHYLSSAPRVLWEVIKRLVAAKLIGVSPLPDSPPAPWGSIIIADRHRCHRQMPFGFRCISFIADPFGCLGALTVHGSSAQVSYLMNVYSVVMVRPVLWGFPLGTFLIIERFDRTF